MATSCTGTPFSDLTLDYSDFDENGNFYVEVTADSAWDEGTKVKVNGEYAGMTFKTKGIKLCDYLTSNSVACGQDGTVEINIGPLMHQGVSESLIEDIIADGYIVAKTKVNGVYETCQVGTAPTSIQTASNPYVTRSSATSVISTLVGAFALVGLAGYAWKRHKSSTSENDADQRLYTGDIA